MYDFYKEPRHLNKKKVAIVSIIFVIILILIILLIARKISAPKAPTPQKPTPTSTVFHSPDNSISLELSDAFNLKPSDSNLGYLMELRSENNLNIFITKEKKIANQELLQTLEAEKTNFLSNFNPYSNLSDTKELSVNGNLAYMYSFHYFDQSVNQAFYLQVVWLQINDSYYIFDIEFPLNDLSFNTNITSAVLSSFKINN